MIARAAGPASCWKKIARASDLNEPGRAGMSSGPTALMIRADDRVRRGDMRHRRLRGRTEEA